MVIHHLLLALLTVLIWGLNFVFTKIALEDVSPLMLCSFRFLLATFPLIFWAKRPKISFKILFLFTLLMFAAQQGLLLFGMKLGVTPGVASLVLQFQVFPTIFFAFLFLGERPHFLQIIGALIAFSGIGVIMISSSGEASALGTLMILGAATSWGAGNLVSKKLSQANVNPFSLVLWASLLASPMLFITSLLIEGPEIALVQNYQNLSWKSFGAILYMVYPSTLVGYWAWNFLLREYPAATIAPFSLLVPIVGILSSNWMLGEPIESWKIMATALVIGGVSLNLFGPLLKKHLKKISTH